MLLSIFYHCNLFLQSLEAEFGSPGGPEPPVDSGGSEVDSEGPGVDSEVDSDDEETSDSPGGRDEMSDSDSDDVLYRMTSGSDGEVSGRESDGEMVSDSGSDGILYRLASESDDEISDNDSNGILYRMASGSDDEVSGTAENGGERSRVEERFLLEAADTDTSDEEEIRNTVGNIPMEWYDELAHLGYDIDGKMIPKPLTAGGDEVRGHGG